MEFHFNYTVGLGDLSNTLFCKKGYCEDAKESTVKALLHLCGMDVSKPYQQKQLEAGQSYHSHLTDKIDTSGVIFVGIERTDENWKNDGKVNVMYNFLYTEDGVEQVKNAVGGK